MTKRTHDRPSRRVLLKSLPAGALLLHAVARGQQAKRAPGSVRLLIGTSGHGSKGVYAAYFSNGQLSPPTLAAEAANPSFLALPDTSRGQAAPALFAVTQPESENSHASSFAHPASMSDLRGERFTRIGDASSTSTGGCHVSCTRDGSCVFVANYGGGSVASFHADAQGNLTLASLLKFPAADHGPDKDRQTQSYAHSARPSPDEGYVLVNDLGLDRIHILKLDRATATLTPHGEFKARPASGPRHLVYHSNGQWIYSINELNSSIDQLTWDSAAGTLTLRNVVGTLPHFIDWVGKRACEMAFSPGEKFLYASNRVYEDFVVFAVNPQTGVLSAVQHLPNPGKESRHIAVDPTGQWLLSANQFSDDITVYPIDTQTGKLGASTCTVTLGAPSCLLFG